jgi:ElaA protein
MSEASSGIHWRCCPFDELSVRDLQRIHIARQQVFVIEQHCVYLDADEVDEQSWHLAAWRDGSVEPLAYARIVSPGVKYAEASIGRVITSAPARGTGLGRELVRRAVEQAEAIFPRLGIRISAQAHLARFYAGFGFAPVGEEYLEDGIPHIEMLRPPAVT